jgi:hypothetical protein
MTSVWFGAFDAERAWDDARLAKLPAVAIDDGAAAMDEALGALAGPGDRVLTRAPLDAAHAEHLAASLPHTIELGSWQAHGLAAALAETPGATPCPWAITPPVVDAWPAGARAHPPLEVVRRVNSKLWSAALRPAAGAGAAIAVRGTAGLERAARALLARGAILVKEPYGVSGRGAQAIAEPARLERLLARLRRDEERGLEVALVVEAMIDRARDFSTHVEVTPEGSWTWRGACGLDNRGLAYAGSAPLAAADAARLDRDDHRAAIARVAERLAAEGYRGPVCIDGILATDGALHSMIEINARCSLGLACLSLGACYAPRGLAVALAMVRVAPARPVELGDVLASVRAEGALAATAGAAGAVFLTATTVGRLLVAIVHADRSELPARRAAFERGLARAGLRVSA